MCRRLWKPPTCAQYVTADDTGRFEEASLREAEAHAATFAVK